MDIKLQQLINKQWQEISVRYDFESQSLWVYATPTTRPCYTMVCLNEFRLLQLELIEYFNYYNMKPKSPIKYIVNASSIEGIFNYGGDLNLFSQLIAANDVDGLYAYAKLCVDIIYANKIHLGLPIKTIALVEGNALGGGFESMLSSNIIIAEEECQMGFPEIRFNLIPGMGAYSFLGRILGMNKTEEIIRSGKMYDSKKWYDLGVISYVAKKDKGYERVMQFMKEDRRQFVGTQALLEAREICESLEYDELIKIIKIWVKTSLDISPRDLKLMKKLVEAQNTKVIDTKPKCRTRQDRRFTRDAHVFPLISSHGKTIGKERRISQRRQVDISA